jgi:hypothetical protein
LQSVRLAGRVAELGSLGLKRARYDLRELSEKKFSLNQTVPSLCGAGLGRKKEALSEGRRAVELLPVEKDSLNGILMIKYLAVIAAWVGEKISPANSLPPGSVTSIAVPTSAMAT